MLKVANLDLPYDAATYMHRVGRTGRFGTHGVAVAFVTAVELEQLRGFLQDVAGGQVRCSEPAAQRNPAHWYVTAALVGRRVCTPVASSNPAGR